MLHRGRKFSLKLIGQLPLSDNGRALIGYRAGVSGPPEFPLVNNFSMTVGGGGRTSPHMCSFPFNLGHAQSGGRSPSGFSLWPEPSAGCMETLARGGVGGEGGSMGEGGAPVSARRRSHPLTCMLRP